MKKISRFYLLFIGCLCIFWLVTSCWKREHYFLLTTSTKGKWEWVSTTTPTRVLTPQSVGYTRQFSGGTDEQGIYVGFYKNDTLQRRVYETSRDTTHTFVDHGRNTVLIKYGGAGFIKYYVATGTNNETITVSELLNPYTLPADTIRSVYRSVGNKPLYPY
ncbi:hypothetical protein [Spirosoma agri]|uniref:Uncharacterized protein n=1 Tax=Spirosoma agri TaxID=1987381 RepID=A0A6M0IPW9_9BACT|nr:hypothetical protein [Spirosoma agri]NEU70420.1 hypothetical protein [Spirosoma agri]